MGRRIARSVPPFAMAPTAHDTTWPREARDALCCAALLLGLLLVVDAGATCLNWARALLWTALAALFLVVLIPPRVSAGEGWLASQGLLRRSVVRTDRLVSARWSSGVAQRLVLRDAAGARVEVDPRVFVANPALWHVVSENARSALARGTLLCGATALRQLAERVDRETAREVFKASGLD
ncbi:hypothetical protein [Streptomyces sp. NPDC000410]|uniref:hypothetical protein n=1 Tax=Streptomyces sp. NPDC000410 TaxID=3154254 RepID=UPI00331FB7AA